MKKFVEHWYYTCNELWEFHSFDDEPAIVIDSYVNIKEDWEEEKVDGYKARYNNGERLRTERDCWDIFINNEISDGD